MWNRICAPLRSRWRALTGPVESDRGDSPIPTVIIWIGVAVIAVSLLTWAGTYITTQTQRAPTQPGAPVFPQGGNGNPNGPAGH